MDIGTGSIFEHIISINEELSKRLNMKVDLREYLLQSQEKYSNKPDQQEVKKEKRIGREEIEEMIHSQIMIVKGKMSNLIDKQQKSAK